MRGESRSGSEITERNHSLIPSLCKFVFQYDFVWERVKTHPPVLKVSWYCFLSEFAHVYKPAVHVRKLKPLRALARGSFSRASFHDDKENDSYWLTFARALKPFVDVTKEKF